jgi:hypothetical protein
MPQELMVWPPGFLILMRKDSSESDEQVIFEKDVQQIR